MLSGELIRSQQTNQAAELNELCASSTDGRTVVAPEICDGLVARHQSACQPHQFHIAPCLPLEPAAGRDPVQIAMDEQPGRPVRAAAWRWKPSAARSSSSTKNIDNTNKIVFSYPVIQTLRKKCSLIPANTLDETRHVKLHNPMKG